MVEEDLQHELSTLKQALQRVNLHRLELEKELRDCQNDRMATAARLEAMTEALAANQQSLTQLQHDLSSPLAAIVTWVEILQENVDESTREQGTSLLARGADELTEILNKSRRGELG